MATASQWIAGARPRTLPAAVAPVVAGTGAALYADGAVWWKAVVCLLLSLALQVGVNYANDYSDGVKGTDDDRVGPMRLVGSGAASASTVKHAAFACFGVGGALGLVLAATSGWWLLLVGVAAIAAAWFYTGGSRPYGYHALGEVSVFLFFGLVAVLGTTYVQLGEFTGPSLAASIGIGALACAILVANNIRDIPTDTVSGKQTLAVVLGDRGSRVFFVILLVVALVTVWWLASYTPAALFGLLAFPWALRAATPIARGERGLGLLPTLRDTGIAELVYAIGIAVGLTLGA
ncbi:1,4-dihydroxy-2-naphthoate polyprenyltransferase [Mumia sp. ZJ1417]|uniref:1,4-dihydroxy-2-naphthoate polyprenyltransferase n=1 Tax=Mumia sp. ZJ1417 TaxID=2708082 RepID=UPI001420307F|nr:1,4-dihydroxy-2-naphthoate polyprenyltransferase [Mumia sp. ZJ1417]QMW65875.1 1,4-dihydroxy-2-naphthoate polyprenyltransferase [Mumia sp. ZJ1417]